MEKFGGVFSLKSIHGLMPNSVVRLIVLIASFCGELFPLTIFISVLIKTLADDIIQDCADIITARQMNRVLSAIKSLPDLYFVENYLGEDVAASLWRLGHLSYIRSMHTFIIHVRPGDIQPLLGPFAIPYSSHSFVFLPFGPSELNPARLFQVLHELGHISPVESYDAQTAVVAFQPWQMKQIDLAVASVAIIVASPISIVPLAGILILLFGLSALRTREERLAEEMRADFFAYTRVLYISQGRFAHSLRCMAKKFTKRRRVPIFDDSFLGRRENERRIDKARYLFEDKWPEYDVHSGKGVTRAELALAVSFYLICAGWYIVRDPVSLSCYGIGVIAAICLCIVARLVTKSLSRRTRSKVDSAINERLGSFPVYNESWVMHCLEKRNVAVTYWLIVAASWMFAPALCPAMSSR